MTQFIEFTDKGGIRKLLNFSAITEIISHNKTAEIHTVSGNVINLYVAFQTIKDAVKSNLPILECGCEI